MTRRAVAPVVGVTVMVLITVVIAALVGVMFFGIGLNDPPEAAIIAAAERPAGEGTEVTLTHMSGDVLDATELKLRVAVNGEPLAYQPTVPATGMTGYDGIPRGPFNSGSADHEWSAGEIAGFEVSETTNAPQPAVGDRIVVRIFVDGYPVAVVETTVR